jgi:hydrogenase-4 component E
MGWEIEPILVALVLINLVLHGASRLTTAIRAVALQGVLLGVLALLVQVGWSPWRGVLLFGGSVLLKGVVFPRMLWKALRGADIRREVEPLVPFTVSVLLAMVSLALCLWLGARLPLPEPPASPLLVPVALATSLTGLFLIIARSKAVTQVLGYLVLENGVFAFGVALSQEAPLAVELGVLLDVFVAVLVMGIIIHSIREEFDHIDTDRLVALKD